MMVLILSESGTTYVPTYVRAIDAIVTTVLTRESPSQTAPEYDLVWYGNNVEPEPQLLLPQVKTRRPFFGPETRAELPEPTVRSRHASRPAFVTRGRREPESPPMRRRRRTRRWET